MERIDINLKPNKSVYFASDFHLGAPKGTESSEREKRIVRWLDYIQQDAQTIFLVGDIFDFWFEYKHVIPKGFIRFQGKLASLVDQGVEIHFFHGNHDMWMFDYFKSELGIPIHSDPVAININNHRLYVGHGDGLGPGERSFKVIRRVFRNGISQKVFHWIHPNLGVALAQFWSKKSRQKNSKHPETFDEEKEWLLQHCKDVLSKEYFDYFIFGHRHLPLEIPVGESSSYINLGEWINYNTYAVYKNDKISLKEFTA
jgi:UDP-2,3-diacylglucosamine hydrolase